MVGNLEYALEDLDLESVKKRTISGILALTFRTFFLQIIGLVAFGIYGSLFEIAQLGTYSLVLAVKNFLSYFSDIGLAGALIQKKEVLTNEDLKSTFLIQQSLVIFLLVVLFFTTPFLQDFYKWSDEIVYLLWALAVSFFISSLRTIPTVILERKLQFEKLIIPQIADTIVFNATVIYLATQGFGLTSFTVGVLLQALVGLVLTYILQPWTPGFAFSKSALKTLLRFGVPYQTNTFLAMLKDDGLILILGRILGDSGVGLLMWGQKWGQAPLRFFMDQVIKVTFPAFSRIQDKSDELANAVSRAVFFVCFLVFPAVIGLAILAPVIIEIVPRYAKWQPALFALSMFGTSALFAAVTTPLTNALNAIGKIKITFYLMIMWTVLSWGLIPFLAIHYGVNGAAVGYALVSSSSVIAIFVVRKYVLFSLGTPVLKPLVASFGMGTILFVVRDMMPPSLQWIFILLVFGGLVYILGVLLLVGQTLLKDVRRILYALIKK